MADPGDLALLVHDKRGRDSTLAGGFHPSLGHGAGFAVHSNRVGHLVAPLGNEILYLLKVVLVHGLPLFPNAHTGKRHLVAVLLLKLRKMGNADLARAAP